MSGVAASLALLLGGSALAAGAGEEGGRGEPAGEVVRGIALGLAVEDLSPTVTSSFVGLALTGRREAGGWALEVRLRLAYAYPELEDRSAAISPPVPEVGLTSISVTEQAAGVARTRVWRRGRAAMGLGGEAGVMRFVQESAGWYGGEVFRKRVSWALLAGPLAHADLPLRFGAFLRAEVGLPLYLAKVGSNDRTARAHWRLGRRGSVALGWAF
jgi:hypothetical protein